MVEKTEGENLLIGFAGDVMIGRLVNAKLSETSPEYVWGDVLPLLKQTDINIINLETALTNSDKIVPKVFNFKADPEKVNTLTAARIDIVNLANNHVLDFSEEGLIDTIQTLKGAGINYVGAGMNADQAARPVTVYRKGLKIGLIGYTDNEPGWRAGAAVPGTNYLDINNIDNVKEAINSIRRNVDILIISIHWGPNMREHPYHRFVTLAHQLIDAGVDIIHGHSAHIFQGIELYKKSVVMFDTGDFVDDYRVDPYLRNDRSFFFLCRVDHRGAKGLKLVPVQIGDMQVNLAKGTVYEWTINRMQQLSAAFGTKILDNGEVVM